LLTRSIPKIIGKTPKKELRSYFLHHDNAPAHTAGKTCHFIAQSGIEEILRAPYPPDLAPCGFYLFPKIKKI